MLDQFIVSVSAMLPDLLLLAGAGLIAGFVAGLFGVGGGTVTVPVLFHWFLLMGASENSAMHVAVGTSLATIIATSLSSMRAHNKKGAVDMEIIRNWGPFVAGGACLGVFLASLFSGDTMRGIFGGFLLCIAFYMLTTREGKVAFTELPRLAIQRTIAGVIGAISSLVGVGGGAMSVPALSLYGVPLPKAVGTSSAFGMMIAVPGVIGFILSGWGKFGLPAMSLGYVNLLGLAVLLPTTALMAPIGAQAAHKLSRPKLRLVFSLFLTFVAVKMLWNLLMR